MVRRDPVRRLNVGLLLVAFVLSLFAGRLVQLQGIESKGYAEAAVRQRLSRIELPAVRGSITFTGGRPLAMTVDARVIYADPVMVDPGQRGRIAGTLASMFGGDPAALVRKLTPKSKNSRYVELIHHVEPDRARMVTAMDFKGIGALKEYRRVYPGGSLAANVVGFVRNSDGDGGAGLEYSMNRLLKGRSGWQKVELSESGQRIPMGEDQQSRPIPGRGLRLTLDQDIQWKAQNAIARQVKATEADSGSIIVMDPRSGQVVAMATAPTFDPEHYSDHPDHLGNRVVQEGFEPGSTSKVVTAAAVMEAGGVTPDTTFTVPDHIRLYDRVFHDAESHKTERLTFAGVLARSSNVGTILASEKISPSQLYDYMRAFGYGERTGIELPGESSGLLKPPDQWWATDRYSIAFGQSVSVNALQVASVYATIANGGVRVAPNLIAGTTDEKGEFTAAPAPARRTVISRATADALTRMLEGVISEDGTAPEAQIPGYRVAGKTGTAQRVNPACGCYRGGGYTSTFVGFAPADDPRLVVEVVLQRPRKGYYGGQVAAPVFKDVMSFALQSRRIPSSTGKSQNVRISADRT